MGNRSAIDHTRKNLDFIQLSRQNMSVLREMAVENPTAMAMFMFLSQHMDRSGAIVCSQTLLQEALGKSRKSIFNAIKYLKEKNLIEVLRTGTANMYALNYEIVWASWNTNKKYAAFKGNILISKSENEEFESKVKKIRQTKLDVHKTQESNESKD